MSSSMSSADLFRSGADLLDGFLDAIEAFDSDAALTLARDTADRYGIEHVVTRLLVGAQQEVGHRWEFGDWTVAQEHAATAIVDDCLAALRRFDQPRSTGPRLIIVCAEGEWHVTPARMAELRFRQRGWQVRFIGGSVPPAHLAQTLPLLDADVVAVSCTLPLNLPGARHTVAVAHDLGLPVAAGGAAFDAAGLRAAAIGADAGVGPLEDLERQMRGWLDRPPELAEPTFHHPEEVRVLRGWRDDVVDLAYADLLATLPGLADVDDDRLMKTREDLDYIVRFLEVASDVGDPTVFDGFLRWLHGLLAVRGVPSMALVAGLDALERHLPPDLTHARGLLTAGMERLNA